MRTLPQKIGFAFLFALIVASTFFLTGNKYDTAEKLKFTLLVGVSVLPMVAAFLWRQKIQVRQAETILLLGFIAWTWLSFFFSQTKNVGFTEVLAITGAVTIFLTLTFTQFSFRIFLRGIIILAVLGSLLGLWLYATQFEPRVAGFFFEPLRRAHFFPNAFALFLLMVWPLTADEYLKKSSWIKGLSLVVILVALGLTFSRGAWLTFILQAVLLAYFERRRILPILRKMILPAICIILLIAGLVFLRGQNFPIKSFSERQTSVQERLDFFQGAVELAAQKPWFGFGPFSFGYAYRSIQKNFLEISDHPHNWFLKVSAESGVPALILLVSFFGIIFWKTLRKNKSPFLALAVLGGLLHNLIDYNLNFYTNLLLFWILLAFLTNENENGISTSKSKYWLVAPILLAVVLFFFSAREGFMVLNKNFEATLAPRNYYLNQGTQEALARHVQLNPLDAQAHDRLGQFEEAVRLDPKNNFSYYRHLIESGRFGETSVVKKLLEEYRPLFEANAHFTVFTENPMEAARLYDLFGEKKKAEYFRTETEKLRKAIIERKKFSWEPILIFGRP